MTDAPERIWAGPLEELYEPQAGEWYMEQVFSDQVPYIREDLTPQWQPIETAPVGSEDGGYILVWDEACDRVEIVRKASDGTLWWGDWDVQVFASYWMFPPSPPQPPKGK